MTDFIPPTKEELKQKYNITNDDFTVLTINELPEPSALQILGQYLEPVFRAHGIPTFLLKSKLGAIISVLMIYQWGPTAVERISHSVSLVQSAYNSLQIPDRPKEQKYRYAIVTQDPITLLESQAILATGSFPADSGVYPYPYS